jgi:hypothetical protein
VTALGAGSCTFSLTDADSNPALVTVNVAVTNIGGQ